MLIKNSPEASLPNGTLGKIVAFMTEQCFSQLINVYHDNNVDNDDDGDRDPIIEG